MIAWLLRGFGVVALAGFAAAVWYAGPLIGFAEAKPLETVWSRAAIIGFATVAVVLSYGTGFWLRHRRQKALERAVARSADQDGDTAILEERMTEVIATLKTSSGKRNFLYEVPWYIIIGPPGTGKTTALVNSGLNFPLADAKGTQAVPGVGGTRNCDWWFTDEAVLLDTAGRYTTQDSDAEADAKSWLGFLRVLKLHRKQQPINGVILAISLSDLISSTDAQLAEQTEKIRQRLREIHATLNIHFPVYVLFTKADLVSGFSEYFGAFDAERRRQVWGATFQTTERGAETTKDAPAQFDALAQRLAEETQDRLDEEQDPAARIPIFGFAAQVALLKGRVMGFLARVFEPGELPAFADLRGFYLSSGTQEGTPIDQLLGNLGRSFGGAKPQLSGAGKSFFLHDLLAKVIFAESGWVSYDATTERRRSLVRYAGLGAIACLTVACLAALGSSFAANRSLISETRQTLDQYRQEAEPLLRSGTVADIELENVIGPLDMLRNLEVGYENREQTTPIKATFGLGQRERLQSAAETSYRQALETMLRSRLLLQLEQTIQANIADPNALYEPLKIYLMLCGKAQKPDDELIISWIRNDWEQNRYPGARNHEGRIDLEKHLRAMLALDDEHDPTFEPDTPLVQSAQRSLGRMTLADRATAIVRSAVSAADLTDFSVSQRAGPEAPLVFERVDGGELSALRVPGIYTYDGFNDFYLAQLANVAETLTDDQWVIGAGMEQGALAQDLLGLGPELLDRYGKDFAKSWNGVLDRLKLKSLSADKPDYLALSAVSTAMSPLNRLFEAIAAETMLSRARSDSGSDATAGQPDDPGQIAKGLARIGIELANGKSQSRAGLAFASGGDPGSAIEAQFRPFHALIGGQLGQRPIDALAQNFHEIYQSLKLAVDVPSQADRANANLQLQISTLRANASRLPKQLATMVRGAVDDFEGDVAETSMESLNKKLAEAVTTPCEDMIAGKYPFTEGSADDLRIVDFAKLFAPGGVFDRFFAQNLSALVDMNDQAWDWNQETRLGREMSKQALRSFELASRIRSAYFPLGGTVPSATMTITPSSLNADADAALLNVDGQVVQSSQTGNTPSTLTWPGNDGAESASLSLTPELPGRASSLDFEGPWALKRLLEKASLTKSGDTIEARFVIGGRDATYTIDAGPAGNLFALPALSAFSCPTPF